MTKTRDVSVTCPVQDCGAHGTVHVILATVPGQGWTADDVCEPQLDCCHLNDPFINYGKLRDALVDQATERALEAA